MSVKRSRKIEISSDFKNLKVAREFVGSIAKKFGFDEIETEKIILAVDEVCTNSIKHSYKGRPDGEITIEVETDEDKFTVIISYNGLLFDPAKIKVESPVKRFKRTGRIRRGKLGMFIIHKFMDDVRYQIKNGRNVVTLIKFLKSDEK